MHDRKAVQTCETGQTLCPVLYSCNMFSAHMLHILVYLCQDKLLLLVSMCFKAICLCADQGVIKPIEAILYKAVRDDDDLSVIPISIDAQPKINCKNYCCDDQSRCC